MKTLALIIITLFALPAVAESMNSANGEISTIGEEYGNLETSLDQDDLDTLELTTGDTFTLSHGENSVTVTLGKTYEDVEKGEWISFLNWEDKLRIARSFENAAETLGAKAGDAITITRTSE